MFLLLLPLLLISAATLAAAACSGDQDCEAEHYCYKMLCYSPHQIAQQAFNAGIRQSCVLMWCGTMSCAVVCGVVSYCGMALYDVVYGAMTIFRADLTDDLQGRRAVMMLSVPRCARAA